MKRLIVNADDFGFTYDVNAGIMEAHTQGVLTAATLMANGNAFDDAVQLAQATPSLDVGIHFVLIGGQSLLTGKPFPKDVLDLVRAVYAGELDLYGELAAQANKIKAAGMTPTHADTHKHTHLLAPVCRALRTVAEEFQIPFLRRPADLDVPFQAPLKTKITNYFVRRLARGMDLSPLQSTDHFAGFALTGRYGIPDLQALFAKLPDGVTELMTHPGHCTVELQNAPTRLKQSRAEELKTLIAPETRAALDANHIILTRYQSI